MVANKLIKNWRINVSCNDRKDTSDVTGNTAFEWDDASFVFGPQNGEMANPFEDVENGKYYGAPVLWAVENGSCKWI